MLIFNSKCDNSQLEDLNDDDLSKIVDKFKRPVKVDAFVSL